jgi:transcriptional regulator with XRE-family HTH domain
MDAKIFLAALNFFVDKEPSQRLFASKVGISPSYLNDLLKERRTGELKIRQKIAKALGFKDLHGYADFMAIGERILKGEDPNLKSKVKSQFMAALKYFSDAPGVQLSQGMTFDSEDARRAIVKTLGHDYDGFLRSGQAILDGRDPVEAELEEWRGLTGDVLRERGFITVPFSDNMKLAAGGGGTIPITEDSESSPVVVYGPALGRSSPRHLQAFRVGGDSMEPLIAEGGLVVADTSENDIRKLKDGKIYVLCWDLAD